MTGRKERATAVFKSIATTHFFSGSLRLDTTTGDVLRSRSPIVLAIRTSSRSGEKSIWSNGTGGNTTKRTSDSALMALHQLEMPDCLNFGGAFGDGIFHRQIETAAARRARNIRQFDVVDDFDRIVAMRAANLHDGSAQLSTLPNGGSNHGIPVFLKSGRISSSSRRDARYGLVLGAVCERNGDSHRQIGVTFSPVKPAASALRLTTSDAKCAVAQD